MKRGLLAIAMALSACGFSQNTIGPFRIPIRHADPWAVKAMIEGAPLRFPENSTIAGFAGTMAKAANAAQNQLLKDGFLVVNSTDNSLWYFPNK